MFYNTVSFVFMANVNKLFSNFEGTESKGSRANYVGKFVRKSTQKNYGDI